MARIEWSALGGQEVETVVSMLMFNEYSRATRIRPSKGDYGIDLVSPSETVPSRLDVFQIKKFAANLTDSQKRQIEDSFQRVLLGLVRKGVPLGDWYLVMPLDPTPENLLEWFRDMPTTVIDRMAADTKVALTESERSIIIAWRETPGRRIEWWGLTYCETLASRYWFVADYYLHGGAERIKSAVDEVAKILHRDMTLPMERATGDGSAILDPTELREHLLRLGRVLDGDPHFRYGISIDPVCPELHPEDDLIAAVQDVAPDGMCTTFRIYTRFSEALSARPIPIKVTFHFEPDSAEQAAFENWRKYGTPLEAEVGVAADLPGGLGGAYEGAVAQISAADSKMGTTRYRVVSPEGDIIAELSFNIATSTGPDQSGRFVRGADDSGTVAIEALLDLATQSGRIGFSFGNPSGNEAVDVCDAVAFMAGLRNPNRLQVAAKHGPFADYRPIPEPESPIPSVVATYVSSLAAIQAHTSTPIVVPDLDLVDAASVRRVIEAAQLLAGETVEGTWTPFEFTAGSEVSLPSGGHFEVATDEALDVEIGTQTVRLGAVRNVLRSATIVDLGAGRLRVEPRLNNTGEKTLCDEDPPLPGRMPVRTRPVPEDSPASSLSNREH